MKISKTNLMEMVGHEIQRQLKESSKLEEGLAVDEDQYFRMKDRCKKDMAKIYELCQRLEDVMYEDQPLDDPMDLVEKIQEICNGWES